MASLKSIQTTSQTIIEGYWTEERAISRHKVAVLVEGDDDKELLEAVLSSRMKTWATSVHVIAAGGRNKVLKRLQKLSADGDGTIQFPDGTAWWIVTRGAMQKWQRRERRWMSVST